MDTHFETAQLTNNIWAIQESIVRCFLIEGSERAIVLDSCVSKDLALAKTVSSLTSKPYDLVFTHTDLDHTGGQDGFDAPLLHPSEYSYYNAAGNKERERRALWEGEVLDLGEVKLEAILLPGHTPGSIALLDRVNKRIFVGDTVSDGWIHMFGEGRSLTALAASLKKLELMTSSFDVIHPCHGSAELDVEWVTKVRVAAELLLAGKLESTDAPHGMPCKLYSHEGVNLLY